MVFVVEYYLKTGLEVLCLNNDSDFNQFCGHLRYKNIYKYVNEVYFYNEQVCEQH